MPRSTQNSAAPIFNVVYFFRIIAIISVPPLDAPTLNRIAEPNAGSTTAYTSSSTGWFVIGPSIGNSTSATLRPTEVSRLTYTVFTPNPLPRKINPTTSSAIFRINVIVPGDTGITAASSTARPVTPPKENLFGNLNRYVPTTITSVATVRTEYSSTNLITFPIFLYIFPLPRISKI